MSSDNNVTRCVAFGHPEVTWASVPNRESGHRRPRRRGHPGHPGHRTAFSGQSQSAEWQVRQLGIRVPCIPHRAAARQSSQSIEPITPRSSRQLIGHHNVITTESAERQTKPRSGPVPGRDAQLPKSHSLRVCCIANAGVSPASSFHGP
jgi:hypothetical protein